MAENNAGKINSIRESPLKKQLGAIEEKVFLTSSDHNG